MGKTLAVQGVLPAGLLFGAPHHRGAGVGGRRSGDVVGTRARHGRAAARVPAPESEWSLLRGEGDQTSFSSGRDSAGSRQVLICRTLILFGLPGSPPRTSLWAMTRYGGPGEEGPVPGAEASWVVFRAGLLWDTAAGKNPGPCWCCALAELPAEPSGLRARLSCLGWGFGKAGADWV